MDGEIERAADRFERLADPLNLAATAAHHTDDLREMVAASDAARAE